MCGRYVLIQQIEEYEKRFNAVAVHPVPLLPNYNVAAGHAAPVITNTEPHRIQFYRFGLTPFWSKKAMYLLNARAEGDHNSDDDPLYRGAKGIIAKPSFRKPIRSQRCLVIADYFIEGPKTEKLDKPYLVYLTRRPFAFAGIWDQWANPETGEVIHSFAIITTTATGLMQKIGHHRSPVILRERDERTWLSNEPLSDITALLEPDDEDMNAYPITNKIKNPRANELNLLAPTGESVMKDTGMKVLSDMKLQGMGYTKRDEKR